MSAVGHQGIAGTVQAARRRRTDTAPTSLSGR